MKQWSNSFDKKSFIEKREKKVKLVSVEASALEVLLQRNLLEIGSNLMLNVSRVYEGLCRLLAPTNGISRHRILV